MVCQDTEYSRILTVQFGNLTAYYGYDADADRWVPCEELPPGFPETLDIDPHLAWLPVWEE